LRSQGRAALAAFLSSEFFPIKEENGLETKRDFIWKMGGQQGQGVESCGEILGKVLAQEGYSLFSQRLFASRIKGGHTTIALRIATKEIATIGEHVDCLVALDQETIDIHGKEVPEGGVIIADDAFHPKFEAHTGRMFLALPITELAKKYGSMQMKNIAALGMSAGVLGFPEEPFYGFIADRFAKKGDEIISKNKAIFKDGYDTAIAAMHGVELGKLATPPKKDQLYLLGNEAAALGAISAGARFMASYPITPATEIMEYMIKVIHKIHGTVVQTEDELSSCMMAMGGGYAGVRAFTATSGPGLSLMAESISMAATAEIPVVIIDVMRAGPSTGMATKVEQSDIRYAIGSGHGDAEKIVLAAASIEDCYYITQEAFNLAEKFQTPVIVLSDLQFGMCKQSVPAFDLHRVGIERGKLIREGLPELDTKKKEYFHRFEDVEDGISPRTIPGVKNGMFLSTGLEHNVFGKPAEGVGDRVMEMEKRHRKFAGVPEAITPFYVNHEDTECDLLLIGITSTGGAIDEACEALEAEGKKVNHLHLRLLSPFPTEALRPYIEGAKKVLIVEEDLTEQLRELFAIHFSCHDKLLSCLQYDGTPFTASTILKKAKEVF
jgi:2-oxoglutarate ferredoxin oxidoreductase subunit alpha